MEEHRKKRRMMDFAEVSDWVLAKGMQIKKSFGITLDRENGNPTLLNYGGLETESEMFSVWD